jgi:hypothetical protein
MLVSYHLSHGGDECIEGPLLVGEHSPTFGGELYMRRRRSSGFSIQVPLIHSRSSGNRAAD